MIKFIYKSQTFRTIIPVTIILIVITLILTTLFDLVWQTKASFPIINLNDVYRPPVSYDNITRLNIKLIDLNKVAIEANKKFYTLNNKKNHDYYDTIPLILPQGKIEQINKIYLVFEDKEEADSIYITVSGSDNPASFYKQIFYSSVNIEKLNKFSDKTDDFRISFSNLVSKDLLDNNDSLIKLTFKDFNESKDSLKLTDCGTNCNFFKEIADKNGLPCRIISLQGGDQIETGFNDFVGYPQHVICEIYSSLHKKWYVVDPTYGLTFKLKGSQIYLNAAEINSHYTFNTDHNLEQDSVLFTKRTTLGRDYFKFYENIYFLQKRDNVLLNRFMKFLYKNFDYHVYHYSNYYPPVRNGFYYFGIKTFMYFIIIILYVNSVIIILIKRLYLVKKPR
ncbi:MAG: transglutaminase domain-containing protein [Ignavibacteria bacterium]|nr:transglutaminase domain-containing protein [Ignavibacteria bacterium]